jgi:ABC-type multidrug transport system fused ATPase/permease subunit
VDGHDVRDYTRGDLRKMFGMVLQDTWLYNDTIMENIRYGRTDATDEEVIAAAQMAHVDHFVHTLPDGYNMVLNEETTNISQGQMQLLTIARAFLADPKILILDEATSSVDTRTEILIQRAMDNLMKGRTSFVIAHRLSTIRDADLILRGICSWVAVSAYNPDKVVFVFIAFPKPAAVGITVHRGENNRANTPGIPENFIAPGGQQGNVNPQ